jgi:pyrroline-5-carboxylate reductase
METLGFIGGGNMAEALIKGIINACVFSDEHIMVSDILPRRLDILSEKYNIQTISDNKMLAEKADILVLSIKPQNMPEVLEEIKEIIKIKSDILIISIAAGIKTANISEVLGNIGIIRVMPNTPALIGEGASALFVNEIAKTRSTIAEKIFSSVGMAVFVETEDLIDAVTAVSGSGPAYYFLLTEELIKAAVKLGLPWETTKKLVLQTAKGASLLALDADKTGESASDLRKKVTSPGGTTEAALKVLKEGNFCLLIETALTKARNRSRELSM